MRNNIVFTPIKFQDNLSCIFVDIQQKVQSQVSNCLLIVRLEIHITESLKIKKKNWTALERKAICILNGMDLK